MSRPVTSLEAILRRDRAVVLAGLAAVVVLAWGYLLAGAGTGMSALDTTAWPDSSGIGATMAAMADRAMVPAPWTLGYALLMLLMWWIMMAAMMLPGAAPMILLFATVNRKQAERGAPFVPAGAFALGYVLAWGGFGVLAAGAQWGLERTGLLSTAMAGTSTAFGGVALVAAGLWQLTPLKRACLRHCRSPLHFLSHNWRKGRVGALSMGLEHGAYCLGCCWVLMGLLFYGGVMNLYWIAGLAAYVLVEKTLPAGHRIGIAAGAGLIVWGIVLLARAV